MAKSSFVLHASIGGLVVKLAVAIRDHGSQMIRPAPGSIPGRCSNGGMALIFCLLLLVVGYDREMEICRLRGDLEELSGSGSGGTS